MRYRDTGAYVGAPAAHAGGLSLPREVCDYRRCRANLEDGPELRDVGFATAYDWVALGEMCPICSLRRHIGSITPPGGYRSSVWRWPRPRAAMLAWALQRCCPERSRGV